MAFAPQQTIAQGATPTLSPSDCNNINGIPLLPATNNYRCGTKTTNRTLMNVCCDGAEVDEYLGCFMHCSIGDDFSQQRMREMVNCLSTNGSTTSTSNDDSVDENVFCQGELSSTVVNTSAGTSSTRPFSASFLVTVFLVLFMLFSSAQAQDDCSFSIEEGSAMIKQGVARQTTGAGTSCGDASEGFCLVDMSGTAEIVGDNRTVNGMDATNARFERFFIVAGEATTPPRLFPARTSFSVRHWGVGAGSSWTNFPYWAPFNYCVNGTASGCDAVDGYVEVCGALFQSTGDEPVPQGVFLNSERPL